MSRKICTLLTICSLALFGVLPAAASTRPAGIYSPSEVTVIIPPGGQIQIALLMFAGWPSLQDHRDAVQMALNQYGPIKGFSLQRNDFTDDCTTPSGTAAADNIVANPQIVGVIGPLCSSAAFGAAPVFNTAGVVMISHANTNPAVQTSGPRVYNRVVLSDPENDLWMQLISNLPTVITWEAEFATLYTRTPGTFAKFAFDAATLLLNRIDQVSRLDGSGNLLIDRGALAAAVRNTSNFQGVTGPITLDVQGNRLHTLYSTVLSDGFDQPSLDAAWSWLEAQPVEWSLSQNPGFLTIYTQDDKINALLQEAPDSNFEIRAHLYFTPTQDFQFAGLIIYGSQDNRLALGRAFCDIPAPTCLNDGNGIYFDQVEGGNFIGSNFAITTTLQSEAYLRVVSSGANFTAYESENGTEWKELGTHTIGFSPVSVGLLASNGGQPVAEIPANFDFFVLQYQSKTLYIPIVQR